MLGGYHHGVKEELSLMPGSKNQSSSDCGIPIPATKPKIWSLADTAACKTPPPLQSQHAAWMTSGYHPHNPHQGGTPPGMMMGGTAMNMMNTNQHPHHQHGMTGGMVNNFSNTPYSRYGGFLGGPHHYNTPTGNMGPQQPPQQNHSPNPIQQQQQLQQQIHQQQLLQHQLNTNNTTPTPISNIQQQQQMGFPEVQTDTPPQTPPNMKLPSVAGNLLTNTTTPTTGTCYNNNNNTSTANNNLSNGYDSPGVGQQQNCIGTFSRLHLNSTSPKSNDYGNQMMEQNGTGFKPFYKRLVVYFFFFGGNFEF